MTPSTTTFMDLTGRFPHKSNRGNDYILIVCHIDSNAILGTPINNRQAHTITQVWIKLEKTLSKCNASTNTWISDNETSFDLQNAMCKKQITYQIVPPHNHRANLAETAIQTFKNHFKVGLSTLHPDSPIAEWDRLLPQAFLTLNLLRPSTAYPNLSEYAYLFGQFDFNKTPLAPPGPKVVIHTKSSNRASYDLNGKIGFHTEPTPNHYRCMTCFILSTRTEIVTDTLVFIPHTVPIPTITIDNFLREVYVF